MCLLILFFANISAVDKHLMAPENLKSIGVKWLLSVLLHAFKNSLSVIACFNHI